MKRVFFKFLIVLGFLVNIYNLFGMVIDKPGKYVLGNDIIEFGTNVITITVDNVILDLGQHTVAGGINGIVVEAGRAGVVIQNGFIVGIQNAGVSIKENCNGIKVEKMQIVQCGGSAIEVFGTQNSPANNIYIDFIISSSCSLSPFSSSVFNAQYGKDIVLTNLVINSVFNPFNTISLVKLSHCNESFGVNILGTNNSAAGIVGMDMINSSSCVFQNCNFSGNIALSADFCGYRLTDSSSLNIFEGCRILAAKSNTSIARGFHSADGCSANILKGCMINALEGVNTHGIAFTGQENEGNFIVDTVITRNIATTGNVIGFLIDGAVRGKIVRSFSGFNTSLQGLAAGLDFSLSSGGSFWTIVENEFVQNNGAVVGDSYGVLLENGIGNVFIKNISSENGTIDTNQFFGVPVTAVTLVTPDTINTINAPWTNVGVVPS